MPFIQCTREALLKPLQTVGGIVEGRQTVAILSNILIEKQNETVYFTTTDLEIQTKTKAAVGCGEGDFSTTLPAAKLTALLNAISGNGTEVSLENDGRHILLKANASKFSLVPLPADGYPQLPVSEMDVHITLPASVLKHLIQMVHFAMAQQDVRFYLNGMLLVLDGKMVRAVATDGHRLACCDSEMDTEVTEKVEAILPRKTIQQLMKLLPDNDDPVTIDMGPQQARFTFGEIEFLTKLIDGKYPDYSRVIPTNNDKRFLVNREELIGALRRAAILANEKFKGLRWVITPGKLHIQSANNEMEEASEDIKINYEGPDLDLGFNVTYLLDVLGNLKNSDVCFAFSSSPGATLLTMPESEQFRYVLMPMRI